MTENNFFFISWNKIPDLRCYPYCIECIVYDNDVNGSCAVHKVAIENRLE